MLRDTLERRLRETLVEEFGYIMGAAGLRRAFGFATQAALRVAITKGHLPVNVFTMDGRKGPFAFTLEVAASLAALNTPIMAPDTKQQPARRKSVAKGRS